MGKGQGRAYGADREAADADWTGEHQRAYVRPQRPRSSRSSLLLTPSLATTSRAPTVYRATDLNENVERVADYREDRKKKEDGRRCARKIRRKPLNGRSC
ncbi:hypothetical protein KM043_002759 [Ampulex compressa]|nr:hypothetical protein KM043_002759 [Ampulex compressa]